MLLFEREGCQIYLKSLNFFQQLKTKGENEVYTTKSAVKREGVMAGGGDGGRG